MRGPSPVAASRGHSSSRCAGLSLSRPLVAEHKLQTRRLSDCGSRAQSLRGMWDPPRPGLEPVSPALAGRLSTTAPPGKPLLAPLKRSIIGRNGLLGFLHIHSKKVVARSFKAIKYPVIFHSNVHFNCLRVFCGKLITCMHTQTHFFFFFFFFFTKHVFI